VRFTKIVVAALLLLLVSTSDTHAKKYGIEGKSAPEWEVSEWLNLPDGKNAISIKEYKGKVIYLTFFQTVCGACHQHGLPVLRDTIKNYEGNNDVAFVAIQTAFEAFGSNTVDGAKKTAKEFELDIPMGHTGEKGNPAPILWTYDAGGTPWTIIIDKEGIVRFNNYKISTEQAQEIIDGLLKAS
jgi:thiol-disulfide isomerase/thioredoxin